MIPSDLPANLKPGMAVEIDLGPPKHLGYFREVHDSDVGKFLQTDLRGFAMNSIRSVTILVPEKPKCRWIDHDNDTLCYVWCVRSVHQLVNAFQKYCPFCGGEIITEEE
jgi:hypothetical protein